MLLVLGLALIKLTYYLFNQWQIIHSWVIIHLSFLQFCNTIWTCLCLDMIVFGPVCLNECLECFLLFRWETLLPTKVLTIFCFSISGEETIFVFPVFQLQYSFAEVFRLISTAQGWCRETEARETKICWAIKSFFLQWEGIQWVCLHTMREIHKSNQYFM